MNTLFYQETEQTNTEAFKQSSGSSKVQCFKMGGKKKDNLKKYEKKSKSVIFQAKKSEQHMHPWRIFKLRLPNNVTAHR